MSKGVFKKHPLLSTLNYKEAKEGAHHCLGLSIDCSVIGVKELRKVFTHLCSANDIENLDKLLSFDFTSCLNLKVSHPFHLTKYPFKKKSIFIDAILEANYLDKRALSLFLQKQIEPWLLKRLKSKKGIFTDKLSDALHIVALYRPELAYERLAASLGESYNLTKEEYEQDYYKRILGALEDLATSPTHFQFAANHLLYFCAREIMLGISEDEYKAINYFIGLFHNDCVRTKVSLETRKKYLAQCVEKAERDKNHYYLLTLLRTVGVAANVFDSGENEPTDDPYFESYIHFAIEILMRYAGRKDEKALATTAENELHILLELTLEAPEIRGATDVPFVILRAFSANNREWNISPFHRVNKLEGHIQELKQKESKNEDDEKRIKLLELRLQQLKSFRSSRAFIAEDFKLVLNAKLDKKFCEVGELVDPLTALDLHARQSLAERLIYSGTTKLLNIQRSYPKCTYVIANLGLVVSDIPHEQAGQHKRVFKSIPIKIPDYGITGRQQPHHGHAEEALYEYLLQDKIVRYYLSEFRKHFSINAANHKIYAIVLDLHGTYDMCLSCSALGLDFQNKFREKILNSLQSQRLKTLTKYPSQLPVIIRYSADIKYDYPGTQDDKKKGVRAFIAKEQKRDLGHSEEGSFDSRDIKQFGPNLLIHGKSNWHSFWSRPKQNAYTNKTITLEPWSAFSCDSRYQSLSEREKHENYTRLGQVDTVDTEELPDIRKLSI